MLSLTKLTFFFLFCTLIHQTKSITIQAQVFCDNFCQIFFNGKLIFEDFKGRTVKEFEFEAPKTGKRTYAVWLADKGYETETALNSMEIGNKFLNGQVDEFGNPIAKQYCLGDGAFRAIFKDKRCGAQIIGTNNRWKCQKQLVGPIDIGKCFTNWDTDSTYPTFGGMSDRFQLFDPCIRSDDPLFEPNLDEGCQQIIIEDTDQTDDWIMSGFNDNLWNFATEYTEEEAVPKGGRTALQSVDDCNQDQYCFYQPTTWGNSEFIWSDDIELDNVVICRFEHERKKARCG